MISYPIHTLISRKNHCKSGNRNPKNLLSHYAKQMCNQYFVSGSIVSSLFSFASMSTSTIEMDDILEGEKQNSEQSSRQNLGQNLGQIGHNSGQDSGQNSVQQSVQLRVKKSSNQNVLQRISQAFDFSAKFQDSTDEVRALDLGNYLNDVSKSSEVSYCIIATQVVKFQVGG